LSCCTISHKRPFSKLQRLFDGTSGHVQVNNDRSRDYTNPGLPPTQPPVLGQAPGVGPEALQASPTAGPTYPGPQYGAGPPPQDSGAQQQMWEYEQNSKAQQGSGPMAGQPMPGQQPMYMSHPQHGGVPGGPSGHHGPPGAPPSHYQGPPGPPTSMGPMSGPPAMGGQMGPPGHMGPGGMLPQGGQNRHLGPPPPPGHSMPPYQHMHGPGPQGMPPSNGGGYYM
jgi:hypothetical protein